MLVGSHMAVETSDVSRSGERPVYVPARETGMAHRSSLSSDGRWALIAEMDGPWLPCHLVPMDGASTGKSVGPQSGACTSAAWSPNGKWMYFTSSAGGAFHIWRQRFPDGPPEQITSGPTEEEGITVAADGSSLVTAVGQRQRSVSLHTPNGDRQVSLEGYAFLPSFTPNFKMLWYRVLKGSQPGADPAELWIADLDSGHTESLLPGVPVFGLDSISPDGRELAFVSRNGSGVYQIWLAPLDRSSPRRHVADGSDPVFGPGGEIYFRAADGFIYRIERDGSGRRKALDHPVAEIRSVSPDGKWLVVWSIDPSVKGRESKQQADFAYPLDGGSPIRILGEDARAKWSSDRKFLFLRVQYSGTSAGGDGKTYRFPLSTGKMFPDIPPGGFRSEEEMAKYPGVRVLDAADIAPGPAPDVYAFSKETTQRNLFRVPIR